MRAAYLAARGASRGRCLKGESARLVISVVIPVLNASATLGPVLGSVAQGLFSSMLREVILVDGGSDDDVAGIAEASGATLLRAPRGRGTQLRAGAAAAKGPWILFLHADAVPPADWPEAARRHVERAPDKAGWMRLSYDAEGVAPRLVAGWANLRARAGLPYGDQALLISKTLYDRVGGHPPIPIMEDVALARALGRRRLAPLDAVVVTSAERYLREGWIARGSRNLLCLARYFAGVPAERIAASYERSRG